MAPWKIPPDVSPVYEGISFFVGVKGEVWGIFPGALWAKSLTRCNHEVDMEAKSWCWCGIKKSLIGPLVVIFFPLGLVGRSYKVGPEAVISRVFFTPGIHLFSAIHRGPITPMVSLDPGRLPCTNWKLERIQFPKWRNYFVEASNPHKKSQEVNAYGCFQK